MIAIKDISIHEVVRPLRVTFATAKGRMNVMRSIIVRVTLADGSSGFGECPMSISLSQETIPVIKGVLNELRQQLQGMSIQGYETAISLFRKKYAEYPMTVSGLEVALFRANLACKGITERAYWGGKTRKVQTDLTIPFILDKVFLLRWMNYGLRKGFTTYKLKMSGNVEQDKEILSFVHNRLSRVLHGFTLCLDGNQGYNKKTFQHIVGYIQRHRFNIEFFEQPLAKDDYHGFKEIKEFVPFPIILDESVITGSDALRVAEHGLAHGINIKIAKSGIMESTAIQVLARKHGLKLMVGCMTETMIGLSAAINLAAGTDAFDYIDLDSVFFLYHKNRFKNLSLQGSCFEMHP
jgi:L-alanine-DL-glutamate epimerase-like enolase superfamily enzyme